MKVIRDDAQFGNTLGRTPGGCGGSECSLEQIITETEHIKRRFEKTDENGQRRLFPR
jgi:hypothetical protein